jgi:hypothetical protein
MSAMRSVDVAFKASKTPLPRRHAQRLAYRRAGALARSRTADPAAGNSDDATMLTQFGAIAADRMSMRSDG